MATLPGQPHPDESEQNSLPVEAEFAPVVPAEPMRGARILRFIDSLMCSL